MSATYCYKKAKPREDLAAVAGFFLSETVCKQ
ncbi:hypothetical protein ABIE41_000109 [Bosea sp. OAE506]